MSQKISAILFDLGGVLVQLDGLAALAELMPDHHTLDSIHDLWKSSPSVAAHETGQISINEFAIDVIAELELLTTPEQFIANFAKWPLNLFPGAFDLLDAILQEVTIAALSNTNPTHWACMKEVGLMARFDHAFLSHEIGHMKPNVEPFHEAIAGMDIPASEILFFDDNLPNVETALSIGMHAHCVLNAQR